MYLTKSECNLFQLSKKKLPELPIYVYTWDWNNSLTKKSTHLLNVNGAAFGV